MAADSAVQAIRSNDEEGSIGVFTKENHGPYDRPPLSKGLWKGDLQLDDVWRNTSQFGVDLHLSKAVTGVEPARNVVRDDAGQEHGYEKLLLATGGAPRRIDNDAGAVMYFRTVDDYIKLDKLSRERDSFGVIGGGFIGSEIAAALAARGKQVTMVFPEKGIGEAIFPPALSVHLNGAFEERGVVVLAGRLVKGVARDGDRVVLATDDGKKHPFDAVVAGLGIVPEVAMASAAGINVGNGIVVDRFLETSIPGIFSAGDVACFTNPALDMPMRFEHEDNANTSGEVAGRNMAGERVPYDHLPFFYSDLFDDGYESVGDVSSRLDVVMDWRTESEEGIGYYMKDGKVRGVLLWNVFGRVEEARSIIGSRRTYAPADVKGLIPTESAPEGEA